MDLSKLIASRKPGHTLPQAFSSDEEVFEADMARIISSVVSGSDRHATALDAQPAAPR